MEKMVKNESQHLNLIGFCPSIYLATLKVYKKFEDSGSHRSQIYKLIPVEMKCRCVDHDCQSVQQAVEVIERYEAILGEAGQDRK